MSSNRYTQAAADEIIERLSKGEPLADICRDEHMPAVRSVSDWKAINPTFAEAFGKARDAGFDVIAADCLRIANSPLTGETETTKEWGTEVKKADMIDHRKLQIDTRLKLLAKWDPRRYGERIQQDIKGELTVIGLASRMRQQRANDTGNDVEDLV